jgi:hypothetical protein
VRPFGDRPFTLDEFLFISIPHTFHMPNSLTRRVGLTIGPLFLETLVKHYFARVIRDSSKSGVPLRNEELLYDEAFNIVKVSLFRCLHIRILLNASRTQDFLSASTRYFSH